MLMGCGVGVAVGVWVGGDVGGMGVEVRVGVGGSVTTIAVGRTGSGVAGGAAWQADRRMPNKKAR
jgi:hypothetical protein